MTKFHHYVLPAVPGLAICIGCFLDDLVARASRRRLGLVLVLGLPVLAAVTVDFVDAKNAAQRFMWLFSYDYIHSPKGRPWPESLDFSAPLIVLAVLFAAACALFLAQASIRRWAATAMCGVAIIATFFLLDDLTRSIAPFWSQKEVIGAYYKERRSPDERLIAYQLYWRGETFYTENEIYEGPMEERTVFDAEGADERFNKYIASHRGRRVFFICEKGQRPRIEMLLPQESRPSIRVVHDSNTKFMLLQAEL